jgi:MFS family permease
MMLARSATLRRALRGSPYVTTRKVGVRPTGSTTTKSVNSAETAKSSGMAGIVPASRAAVLCANAKDSRKAWGNAQGRQQERGVVITLCGNWFSFSFHAYQAELYPTRIRAQAVGFVYSWSRFSAIFSGFLIAFFLGRYGTVGVFSFIAGAMLIVFVVIALFGPAVTRRRLEAIAA